MHDDPINRASQAPGEAAPAYPSLSALDRRRFLAACARSVLLAGCGAMVLGGGAARAQQPPPPRPPEPPTAGEPVPPDWPERQVRLVDEHPIDVTFRDGRTARLVVAVVRGDGPEPAVDREALRDAVREVCAGFDGNALDYAEVREALEASLRARLDDILKACGGSIEAVSVAEAPPEPPQEPAPEPPAPPRGADAPAPRPAPAREPEPPAAEQAPAAMPRPRGRCLIHGDGPCPPSERRP